MHHSSERYNFSTAIRQGALQVKYSFFFGLFFQKINKFNLIRSKKKDYWQHYGVVDWLAFSGLRDGVLWSRPGYFRITHLVYCAQESEHSLPILDPHRGELLLFIHCRSTLNIVILFTFYSKFLHFDVILSLRFQLVPPLGPLEYVLNTPSAHRVHHGRNP